MNVHNAVFGNEYVIQLSPTLSLHTIQIIISCKDNDSSTKKWMKMNKWTNTCGLLFSEDHEDFA